MPLTVPTLDNRTYPDLVREALARIPVHNPAWTNFNDSDPGVTLIQLFAFMTETLLYRANQIPERNRKKFLQLLGIPLRAAQAARGFVTIRNERGPLTPTTISANLDVRAGAVPFRTERSLEVLPIEGRVFFKELLPTPTTEEEQAELDTYRLLYADLLTDDTVEPAFYRTTPLPPPAGDGALPVVDLLEATPDHCLWIALLARPGETPAQAGDELAGHALTIGVMPELAADLGVRLPAGQESPTPTQSRAVWEIARPDPTVRDGRYVRLDARPTVDILQEPGLVELTLPAQLATWTNLEPGEEGTKDYPPSLADTDLGNRVITWLRLRVPVDDEAATPGAVGTARARISWLAINATQVVQRAQVVGEQLGMGTGEPDQRLSLANTPVIPDSLELRVGDELWHAIDDLLAAAPEVPIEDWRRPLYHSTSGTLDTKTPHQLAYMLDPEAGEVRFGDGAHGTRPPRGRRIVATYAYGGGRQGNVGLGEISRSPQLPPGFKVTNDVRTWGGDDGEDVASAERTIPRTIQHRDRLVSLQDFKDITLRTPGVDIGQVYVLPLYNPETAQENQAGIVTLVVIPRHDPRSPEGPQPDFFFLNTICRYLQPRRLITTEIHIRGPIYRDIWVSVSVEPVGGHAAGPLIQSVKQELRNFLSPLHGGRDEQGWPLGLPILQRELEAVVARVDGVRLVTALSLGTVTSATSPTPLNYVSQVTLNRLELPRLAGLEVTAGAVVPLEQLRSAPSAAPDGVRFAPIPVIKGKC